MSELVTVALIAGAAPLVGFVIGAVGSIVVARAIMRRRSR